MYRFDRQGSRGIAPERGALAQHRRGAAAAGAASAATAAASVDIQVSTTAAHLLYRWKAANVNRKMVMTWA